MKVKFKFTLCIQSCISLSMYLFNNVDEVLNVYK